MSSKSDTEKLKLYFPGANGGENVGPSNAGAEFFAGNLMGHLARECAQNAIDARKGTEPIRLSFKLQEMEADQIPEYDYGLTEAWDAASKYYGNSGKDSKEIFAKAKSMLDLPKVPVLVISDYNTNGLEGIKDSDDDSNESWTRLVKSIGVANGSKGAGGAFGIGKMSPFVCSAVRTVFYQTYSKDGWGYQGVVRLMTHRDKKSHRKLQAFGMIGLKGEDKYEKCEISLPITSRDKVPDLFRAHRKPNEFGTDIFVVGFVGSDDWKLHVKAALIINFFPAIYQNIAEFEVSGEKINKKNISSQLTALKKEAIDRKKDDLVKELESTYWYMKASEACASGNRNWVLSENLKYFGEVRIGIVLASKDEIRLHGQLPGRCFMCRSNRMKIFSKLYQLSFPFAAFMICDHESGNEALRRLEPPTHTAWEEERDKSPERQVYEELKKIYLWIRNEVAKLAPPLSEESLTLESVAKAIKGLNLPEEKGSDVDGNEPDSLIKKGVKRSPFVRVAYGDDTIKLPKVGSGDKIKPKKKYKSIDIDSTFTYRGHGRYVACIVPKIKEALSGDEVLRIFAFNFNGSTDAIAFLVVDSETNDNVNVVKISRTSNDKYADISLPSGHCGEINFVIKTEINLLSLTAQLLKPIEINKEDSLLEVKPKKK